jgi:hypothetical protein
MRQAFVENAGDVINEDRDERKSAPEVDGVGLACHFDPEFSPIPNSAYRPASGEQRHRRQPTPEQTTS